MPVKGSPFFVNYDLHYISISSFNASPHERRCSLGPKTHILEFFISFSVTSARRKSSFLSKESMLLLISASSLSFFPERANPLASVPFERGVASAS